MPSRTKPRRLRGTNSSRPPETCAAVIRHRKWVPLTHLLQMPGLQKSLLLFSRLHKRHLVHYCLSMFKCEIQSQDCVIYGIYATSEAAHFKLNYLAPIFKVQEDIMDLWHTIFFSQSYFFSKAELCSWGISSNKVLVGIPAFKCLGQSLPLWNLLPCADLWEVSLHHCIVMWHKRRSHIFGVRDAWVPEFKANDHIWSKSFQLDYLQNFMVRANFFLSGKWSLPVISSMLF